MAPRRQEESGLPFPLVTTLGELVQRLAPPVLHVLTAPRGLDVETSELVLNDPGDVAGVGGGAVVLCPGLGATPDGSATVAALGAAGATAVVIRAGIEADRLVPAADAAGVALLTVPPAAAWVQVVLLLGSVLSRSGFGSLQDGQAGVPPVDDLFAAANVVAELVDAPVTIEDPHFRVLAFSDQHQQADPARVATILGRLVPPEQQRVLKRGGHIQRLSRSSSPVYVELPGLMPRAAIAVRAGDQILGTIWAAVPGPLSAARERALEEAASFVALHLLRHRLASDVGGSIETDLVSALLEGKGLAAEAADRLGLVGDAFRVVAIRAEGPAAGEPVLPLLRCRDLLKVGLSVPSRRLATAVIGATLYAVVQSDEPADRIGGLRAALEAFAAKATQVLRGRVLVGVGSRAAGIDELPLSRTTAERALRVVRWRSASHPVAEYQDVQASALLLDFADAHRAEPALTNGPITALRDHDRVHHTAYLPTLRAWLDAFGDVDAAARALGVHVNTVRYRLRRLRTVAPIAIDDPTERLAIMLQLRLLGVDADPCPGEQEYGGALGTAGQ
jgi:hypothetical protein